MRIIYILTSILFLASCSNGLNDDEPQALSGVVTITSDIQPFTGETMTRVNVEGNDFINEERDGDKMKIIVPGDKIRMKIICPFVSSTERGETTDGNSYDAFYYLKRVGGQWARVTPEDGYDISGTYSASYSPDIASYYEAQQTPYVYVATTWSEERRFIAPTSDNSRALLDHLTPVFHADQTKEKHYRSSDVLWAQTFMQTGAWNIHLGFQHKMACLDITIDDSNLLQPNPDYDPNDTESTPTISAPISDNAVLTLVGMPDIDQAEIVVGDYYADASKINSGYGYRQKSSCSYENNGKVIGIAVNDESTKRARVMQMTGNPTPVGGDNSSVMTGTIANDATYTAFKQEQKHYRLIVPPCVLGQKAVFWLRDGSRRYNVELQTTTFEEGMLYPVTLKLGVVEPT